MDKPMVRVHDLETNEVIDREMTDAEFSDYQASVAETNARLKAAKLNNDSNEL